MTGTPEVPEDPLAGRGRLVVRCADRPGIIAAISRFLFEQGANIIHSDQHSTDPSGGRFFLRVEFALAGLERRLDGLRDAFSPLASEFGLDHQWSAASRLSRVAVFVSREDHCLLELLWRRHSGDLLAEFVAVVSNHPDLGYIAEDWRVPFHHVPVEAATREEAEARQRAILAGSGADLVVLARYMQILSPQFTADWRGRIINIHHSFLPAFAGARPFHQAHQRGVKLIGATAHYVTADLDAGPIIEQDVQRVDHRHSPADLRRISRQTERAVLARAVSWHVDGRVLLDGNKTVVFTG
ncbi:MAG: formyltetrahydrofolate deformylase [Chloroflexota bacterium]